MDMVDKRLFSGDIEQVKAAIASGAPLDAQNTDNWTPLQRAAIWGHIEITLSLLEAGASYEIIDCGIETIFEIINRNETLGFIHSIDQVSDVLSALLLDQRKQAHHLIKEGVDLSITAAGEVTALMIAAKMGQLALVKRLVASGAQINAVDIKGNSALHYAVFSGHDTIAQILIESGADHTINNNQGESPAILKMKQDKPELFRLECKIR
jgi:ankyrin repeat protein